MAELVDPSSPTNIDEGNESSSSSNDGYKNIPRSDLLTKSVQELKALGVPHELIAKKNLSTLEPMATIESLEEAGKAYSIEYKLPNKKADKPTYYCECKSFKFQKRPITERTCKHIRILRGHLAEELRTGYASELGEQRWNSMTDEQKQKVENKREKGRASRQKKRQREKETGKSDDASAFEAANEAAYADDGEQEGEMETEEKKKKASKKKSKGSGGKKKREKSKNR